MTKRKLVLIAAVCLVFGLVSFAQAASTLTKLGSNPFAPPLTSVAQLKEVVKAQQADIQKGFELAGDGALYAAFASQFPKAKIEAVKIQPGETMQWMLYRKKGKGKVRVVKDVTWGGAAAFDAYRFYIDNAGTRYNFVVPLACTNIALMNTGGVPTTPPPPPPIAKTPPPPPVVKPFKHWVPVIDVGFWRQFDPANYMGIRGGVEYRFNQSISLLGMVGGLIKLDGDDGASAFTVDGIVNFTMDPVFIGVGIGYRLAEEDDDSQFDVIFDVGSRVYGNPDEFNISIFAEARIAVSEMDDLTTFSRFGLGLRFKF